MVQKIPSSIVLIGAGNVGTQLGKRLHKRRQPITQVFSRQSKKAKRLAAKLDSNWTSDLANVLPDADLYILAVRDDSIAEVAEKLAHTIDPNSLIVHTSGATPSSVFQFWYQRYGVVYPLQTLSLNQKPKWSKIPICLSANQPDDLEILQQIANRISKHVFILNDEQRAAAHVAAVFANNFPNYLYSIAGDILDQEGLPFDLLRPLILETAEKIQSAPPRPMQTGPAVRGDDKTIARHLTFLKASKDWEKTYTLLTEQIRKQTR